MSAGQIPELSPAGTSCLPQTPSSQANPADNAWSGCALSSLLTVVCSSFTFCTTSLLRKNRMLFLYVIHDVSEKEKKLRCPIRFFENYVRRFYATGHLLCFVFFSKNNSKYTPALPSVNLPSLSPLCPFLVDPIVGISLVSSLGCKLNIWVSQLNRYVSS